MNDRECVPVTTLAGLTSLSDLLSELPVSDTLSFLTSLNKSLLFHPRVAEEANNLLAVREETLVRQLVNAIEQTNSDNIELKHQYTNLEPDAAIPISEEPQLLQAIHAFKSTVFNNVIPNNQRNTIIHNQHNQPHLAHNTQAQNILFDQQQQYNNHQFYQPHLQQIDQNALNYQHGQQQQHNVLQSQPNINTTHMINLTGFNQVTANQTISSTDSWNQIQSGSVLIQQQHKLQSPTQESFQNSYIPQQNTNLNYNTSPIVNKTVIHPSQQIAVQQVNQYQQPNNIQYIPQQQSQNTFLPLSNNSQTNNSLATPIQQNQFSNRTNFNQVLQLHQQNQAVQLQLHQNQISNFNNNEQIANQTGVIQNLEIQHTQKLLPRNNEYLEKQKLNKNLDIRGPSPAKACDALDSNQIQMSIHQQNILNSSSTDILQTNSENNYDEFRTNNINMDFADNIIMKMKPVVCLNRISPEDQELMQESLTEFVKKSPDLARKLGINHDLITQGNDDSTSIFSKMKNDENRKSSFAGKKRGTIDANLENPGELFTKPKLRKVERKISTITTKADKEDIQKSNTYQRFNTFMEKIFELLDETEGALNLDDAYDNVDCISSNLLNNIGSEAAKLKARGFIDWLPQNKLTLLITYAMRSIHVAKNISAGPDSQEEFLIEESLEKILNAIEASLLVCNIYSCRSTSFLQEDNIDAIVKFVQFQLRETIFPSFDPVYTVETKKKHDNKKSKKAASQQKEITVIYSKIVELTKVLLSLFFKFQFEDTIVIHASALGVEPFFVDNIDTLQFVCLDLVTTIFQNEKYSHHRGNILNDILSSVDRLPCSKRNLRPFKLAGNGGNIQMVTALVLQLIQCSVVLPEHLNENNTSLNKKKQNNETKTKVDKDVFIREKYDTALSIGGNFLTTFLNKCKTRSGETDFRPLFENFIQDLLTTVNRPEWPAAELLLSLLGTLLVRYMSDKNVDQPIRVASLEYLGIVAARLRKDTVESRCKVNTMDQLIKCIKIEQEKEGDKSDINNSIELDPEEIRTEFLEKILLDYLAVKAHDNNLALEHARHFCLTQWYRDILLRKKKIAEGEKGYASRKKNQKKRRRHKDETDSESSENDEDDEDIKQQHNPAIDQELNLEIFRALDQRKNYFLSQITRLDEANTTSAIDIKTYIDYSNAHLIAQYLASKRSFSQSFDKYLQKIILVVQEQSIAIRTKAMKCLAMIVEVDPSILQRKDMQMGVHHKFLDPSISVREAAVDLVGKYVLSSPELIRQYYEILSLRILDTGVSVRKRVIKILRDICEVYPDFEKIPEICVKMIRRVNDEEGIQKLVTEVFMNMWFTPCENDDQVAMNRKIAHITTVVSESQDSGTQWLEGLLKSIFESKESKEDTKVKKEPSKTLVLACQQIADGLVLEIVKLEEKKLIDKLLGCVITLHLFAKIRPQLLVHHAISLEPYLNIKLNNDSDVKFISCVAEILEQIVPLIENPSDSFLADLELHLMTLVVSHKQTVVQYCLACLGAIVNKITKNYKLIRDCFCKFYYKSIAASKDKIMTTPDFPLENLYKPFFRRSIYTIGLIMRYFDFKNPIVYGTDIDDDNLPENICNEVYDTLMYFVTCSNINIRKATLISLGSFCVKNFEYLTKPELRDFYQDLLIRDHGISTDIKVTVLRNIFMYLNEAEQILVRNENEWSKQAKNENLKEMGDVHSGMASRVIQLYIKEVLYCFLDPDFGVRFWAMRVVEVVLKQGLVHPVQIVPYLICLGTDSEKEVSHCADHHLQDIDKQYPGFINMKSQAGLQLSYELQIILQKKIGNKIVRGYRIKQKDEPPSALNGFLYSLLRNAKPQRRALIQSITKQFDDTKSSLRQMLYLSDNLAYFPYGVQDEPLYLIHQIDVLISVTGTNLLSAFREGLKPVPGAVPVEQQTTNQTSGIIDEDEEDDKDILYGRLPEDTTDLEKCIRSAQGCMLLLILKQHLKDSYGLTDSKISRYSPSEPAKIYDKAIQRRLVGKFNPKSTVDVLEDEVSNVTKTEENKRRELIIRYLEFKQLMLKLDPDDPDADDDDKPIKSTSVNKNNTTNVDQQQQQQPNINTEKFNVLPTTNNIIIKNTNIVTNNTTTNVVTTKDEQGGHRTSSANVKVKQATKTKSPKKTPRKKKKKSYAVSSSDDSDYSDYE